MKKHSIRLVSLAFTLISATNIFAQKDLQKGYIITLEDDTIYGSINNRNYFENSQSCEFLKENEQQTQTYSPNELSAYRIDNGKFYLSKELNGKKIFFEYLIKGKLNIYFYQDKEGLNHYFAENETSSMIELKYTQGTKQFEDRTVAYEKKDYVGALNYLTMDCPEIKADISNIAEPNHKNTIKIAEKYHNIICKDDKCVVYEKKMPIKYIVDAYGSFDISSYENTFGLNLLFSAKQISERLYIGIGYNSYSFTVEEDVLQIVKFRIPLSFNYIHSKQGLSPLASYEIDLNTGSVTQNAKLGARYKINNISFYTCAQISTIKHVFYKKTDFSLGLMYHIN